VSYFVLIPLKRLHNRFILQTVTTKYVFPSQGLCMLY